MFDLNATLDNLIAMVVVILALSLVVQAVQSAVKKLFKLKSRQIEDSLAHLFQFALHDETVVEKSMPGRWQWLNRVKEMVAQSPFLRIFTTISHPADRAAEYDREYAHAATLYREVMKKFKGIGRVAFSARPIFDSMSKGDLMKVVASVDPSAVDNSFVGNFVSAVGKLGEVYKTFTEWEGWFKGPGLAAVKELSEDDRKRLAEMQAQVEPLLHDLRALLTGESGGAPDSIKAPNEETIRRLAADVARLRAVNLEDAQKVIDDVAANVEQAAARAQAAGDASVAAGLGEVAVRVRRLSEGFASFRKSYAAVFARWAKLEDSFDSVMQSFEERYTRGMKTAALLISFFVVVFLNANFFKVYRQIATSDATREMIIQSREQVVNALARSLPPPAPAATPPADETPDEKKAREERERQAQQARNDQTEQTVQTWLKTSRAEIQDSADAFLGYGFQPLKWSDFTAWGGALIDPPDRVTVLDEQGKPELDKAGKTVTISPWWAARKEDVKTLLGWIVMALLLSVGAPFWQDFLESLFGVKNVLRKRSDTKNVEQEAGTGQPRQS